MRISTYVVLCIAMAEAFAPTLQQRNRRFSLEAAETDDDDFASFERSLNEKKTWQADLERLLDPSTSVAQRQILLSDLLNANAEIAASVQDALRSRKIDPLLTPTGRKLQEGSRAVARQLRTDILPSLTRRGTSAIALPKFEDFAKANERIMNVISNQLQNNLETLQQDLANPTRIPERIREQTNMLLQEAANIFSETPAGLKEPTYQVVATTDDYEIRDYEPYTTATTNMDEGTITGQGVAFQKLASYIFGANAESKVVDMTTPVATTNTGEMRFYVDQPPPTPYKDDESTNPLDTKIRIQEIPAARLAVRRFTGFCTANEIARQKTALLTSLQMDGIELDVYHGQPIGHLVFQYNPPYTLPIVRRNEIAVPILKTSYNDDTDDDDDDDWGAME